MCFDITRNKDLIEVRKNKEIELFDMQNLIITSYDLNQLITWKEFFVDFFEEHYYYNKKCNHNCSDEVNTMAHAYKHFLHLMELTSVDQLKIYI